MPGAGRPVVLNIRPAGGHCLATPAKKTNKSGASAGRLFVVVSTSWTAAVDVRVDINHDGRAHRQTRQPPPLLEQSALDLRQIH